jgi:hypothetical protein
MQSSKSRKDAQNWYYEKYIQVCKETGVNAHMKTKIHGNAAMGSEYTGIVLEGDDSSLPCHGRTCSTLVYGK